MARKGRKALVQEMECVACGCCEKVCPLFAIRVMLGIAAAVDPKRCVGCGKCQRECPAAAIVMMEVEA